MQILRKLYNAWMRFAHALGWVNTRIILTVVYFLVITPVALIFRVIGKDPMNRRPSKSTSYWIRREAKASDRSSYRKQF